MSWQPLLRGIWKDLAWEGVQAILDDLAPGGRDPAGDPSLASGTTGLAILHGYLAQSQCGPEHAALAVRYLKAATAAVAEQPTSASLHSGLTGVGWALAHLHGRLPERDFQSLQDLGSPEENAADIDDVLLRHLEQSPWPDDYDLIGGLVGFGVYALERLPRPAAVACLERVVHHLAETAEQRREGCTWWTNPAWLPAETRARYPHGYYNLGLAHGVPGVIALLARACAGGVAVDQARPLLDDAVRWLGAQPLTTGAAAGLPYWIDADGAWENKTRLAWCYGDPGVAAALLGAAHCLREPAWEREALAMARRASRCLPEQSGVVDAGLCHGAAGLGHLFNRMFQATGEQWLAEAARSWFARTLEMRQPGRSLGGYAAWLPGVGVST
jgi:class I lanthipeptide synthase